MASAGSERHRAFLASAVLAVVAVACGTRAPEAAESEPWRRAASLGGTYEVAWKPEAGELELNEPCALIVQVHTAGGEPVEGADVVLHGWMPGHGHGMVREPRPRELGEGRYLLEGVLLHMSGSWELKIDVVHEGVAETTAFELELE